MAEIKKNTKTKKSSEDVITIDIQPFIIPFSLLLSALFISIGLVIGTNTIARSVENIGVIAGNPDNNLGNSPPDYPGETLPEDPTSGVSSIDDDAKIGSEDAKVAIIEFSDYNCGFCGRFHTDGTFNQIVQNYVDTGKAIYVYRDFPGVGGETTAKVASAAECIRRDIGGNDENFFDFVEQKYSNQNANDNETLAGYVENIGLDRNAFLECAESEKYIDEVYADLEAGNSIGINGTPSFLIGKLDSEGNVDGEIVIGAQPYDSFATAIDRQLSL